MRKKEEALTLDKLIPAYGEAKEQVDIWDKKAKKQNKDIKALMAKLLKDGEKSVDSDEYDGWVATYSIRVSTPFNEEALLEFMHKHKQFAPCIKTKEYIDEDALENLIYKGDIPKKLLLEIDKFRTEKKTEVLNIKKKGE